MTTLMLAQSDVREREEWGQHSDNSLLQTNILRVEISLQGHPDWDSDEPR